MYQIHNLGVHTSQTVSKYECDTTDSYIDHSRGKEQVR